MIHQRHGWTPLGMVCLLSAVSAPGLLGGNQAHAAPRSDAQYCLPGNKTPASRFYSCLTPDKKLTVKQRLAVIQQVRRFKGTKKENRSADEALRWNLFRKWPAKVHKALARALAARGVIGRKTRRLVPTDRALLSRIRKALRVRRPLKPSGYGPACRSLTKHRGKRTKRSIRRRLNVRCAPKVLRQVQGKNCGVERSRGATLKIYCTRILCQMCDEYELKIRIRRRKGSWRVRADMIRHGERGLCGHCE